MINVLIVGDIRLFREGLADLLGRDARIRVVATAGSTVKVVQRVLDSRPDVVLLDMAMADALDVPRILRAATSAVPCVALAVPERESDIMACAEAGIAGYVSREGSLDDLVSAVISANHGEFRCSPRVAAAMLRRIASLAGSADALDAHLTPREIEVVELLGQGYTNKEIARALGIEVPTAKNHVHHILEKLQVQRRGQAVARVRHRLPGRRVHASGLTPLD